MYTKERPETIQNMFSTIARRYDRGNAVLSFSLHRLWNRALVKKVVQDASAGQLLDLCAGTGEIAYAFMQRTKRKGRAILLDFCPEMLECAKEKAAEQHFEEEALTFIEGDAQLIPLEDQSVDFITIAYGIRNVRDPEACLKEAYRVLKPGGRIGILELTRPRNRWLKLGHQAYLRAVLPLMGKLFFTNGSAYDYLQDSIQRFVSPEDLAEKMERIGYSSVEIQPMTGGIATIVLGEKPTLAQRIPLQVERETLPELPNPCMTRSGLHRLAVPRARRRRAVI